MKNMFGRLLVAALVCAGVCFTAVTAQAEKKEGAKKEVAAEKKAQTTLTGAVKAVANKTDATKKHLELTDSTGATYMLIGRAVAGDVVTTLDGKNVKATGTTKDKDGKKTLYVSSIEEAK